MEKKETKFIKACLVFSVHYSPIFFKVSMARILDNE